MKKELTPEEKEKKRIYQIEYRKKNKDKSKIYSERQKEYCKEWKKKDYEKNREERKSDSLKYYHENSEILKIKQKEYKKNNREKLRTYHNTYYKNRKENDTIFSLRENVRSLFYQSFKKRKQIKSLKTQEILGCSIQEFEKYLESKFEYWMNWDNHGKYNGKENYGWDIDHIIPISTAITVADVIRLNHHTNLQPLCSFINRIVKKDTIL